MMISDYDRPLEVMTNYAGPHEVFTDCGGWQEVITGQTYSTCNDCWSVVRLVKYEVITDYDGPQ